MSDREEWRPIRGGAYSVSSLGNVRSEIGRRKGVLLRPCHTGKPGYPVVTLKLGGGPTTTYVHRLVAEAFFGPCPDGLEVNHKNAIKTDNRVENLEYVTQAENVRHAFRLGLVKRTPCRGVGHPMAKLNDDTVRAIRAAHADGANKRFLAQIYDVNPRTIDFIVKGHHWAHVA